MLDPISSALKIAASGLEAQSTRMRVVSENVANARSTGDTPGADPYRRKTVSFTSEIDRLTGAEMVSVKNVGVDRAAFKIEH
ncbi:MAG: flagellar basal body protein, partial [Methylobacterium sp.]